MTEYEFHPLADQYPLMSDADLQALVDDIKVNDLRFAIVLHDGKILDGRNRYRACQVAGVEPEFRLLPKGVDPAAFVESANEHRRHLTPSFVAQRRAERIARVAEKRKEGKSLRVIAEEEGVSLGQVQRDVQESTVSGDTVEPPDGKVTGKDGKKREASKPRKPEPWDEETTPETTASSPQREPGEDDGAIPSQAGGVLLDGLGLPVPKESLEAFGSCALFDELLSLHRKMTAAVHELALSPGGWWFQLRACGKTTVGDKVKFRSDRLHTFRSDIKFNRPFAARCPYCHHEGLAKNSKRCRACTGMPYVSEDLWNNAPQDYRDAMLKDLGGQS